MEEKGLKQECLKLIESVESMYLGTNGKNGTPQIRMMSNMRSSKSCTNAPKVLLRLAVIQRYIRISSDLGHLRRGVSEASSSRLQQADPPVPDRADA